MIEIVQIPVYRATHGIKTRRFLRRHSAAAWKARNVVMGMVRRECGEEGELDDNGAYQFRHHCELHACGGDRAVRVLARLTARYERQCRATERLAKR